MKGSFARSLHGDIGNLVMTRRNISVREALEHLCTFSGLFLGTNESDWVKLPFYGFYKAREDLWCYFEAFYLEFEFINDSLSEYIIIKTFFEFIDQLNSNPNDKYIFQDDPKFWWVHVLWTSNEIEISMK